MLDQTIPCSGLKGPHKGKKEFSQRQTRYFTYHIGGRIIYYDGGKTGLSLNNSLSGPWVYYLSFYNRSIDYIDHLLLRDPEQLKNGVLIRLHGGSVFVVTRGMVVTGGGADVTPVEYLVVCLLITSHPPFFRLSQRDVTKETYLCT